MTGLVKYLSHTVTPHTQRAVTLAGRSVRGVPSSWFHLYLHRMLPTYYVYPETCTSSLLRFYKAQLLCSFLDVASQRHVHKTMQAEAPPALPLTSTWYCMDVTRKVRGKVVPAKGSAPSPDHVSLSYLKAAHRKVPKYEALKGHCRN